MSKVRLFDKRRAFRNDTLKILAGLCCCSRGAGSLSGLAWKATGLANLCFKCHPALQGVSEGMVAVFKGDALCIALKCGVPQV